MDHLTSTDHTNPADAVNPVTNDLQAASEEIATPVLTNAVISNVPEDEDDESLFVTLGETPIIEEPVAIAEPVKNTVLEAEVYLPLTFDQATEGILVALPQVSKPQLEKVYSQLTKSQVEASRSVAEWAALIYESVQINYDDDFFKSTVERSDAEWRQSIPTPAGPALCAVAPRVKSKEHVKLTGEDAVLQARNIFGMGGLFQIPLWHSGFWLTFKAPSDSEALDLEHRLGEEKVALGRRTHGLAFSNQSVIFAGAIIDFAVAHIHSSTLKDLGNIRSKISTLDIPTLAWGLACAMYPRGFPYAQAVPGSPGAQIRETLKIGKLLFTDNRSLSPYQISHMSARYTPTMTDESLNRYHDEFLRGKDKVLSLREDFHVRLSVPSSEHYLNNGTQWVNNIVHMVDKAFSLPPNSDDRDNFIMNHGGATYLRQFTHWISGLYMGSIEHFTPENSLDQESMDKVFDTLSSDKEVREKLIKEVRAYIEDSTVSVIAIPKITGKETPVLPRFPNLLPIDPMSVFFTLLVQKIRLIQARM